MATLSIRNLSDKIRSRLRIRAAKAGRSMEAEAREILAAACEGRRRGSGASELQAFVDELYQGARPESATDELIAERRREAERAERSSGSQPLRGASSGSDAR